MTDIEEEDSFFIVDFSRYSDSKVKLGEGVGDNSADQPLPSPLSGASPTGGVEPSDQPVVEEPFIPAAWRDSAFDLEVERAVRLMFIQEAAVSKKREIQLGKIELPPVHLLSEFLSQPDEEVRYTIEDLWPIGGNVLFAAPAKFGKSTVTMNLVRSLLDGTAFLDRFAVDPIGEDESILLVDLEMNEARVRAELRGQNIQNQRGLHVMPMRGLTSQMDLFHEDTVKLWVAYCRDNNVRTLIIDPLAPLFGYLGVEENDNTSVNKFFQVLDSVKQRAGIRDLLVTHHCGHGADWRPRGASRFNDWPDALWLAKVDGDVTDPTAPRLFFARGRDVGESFSGPGSLKRDPSTKLLSFSEDASAQQQAIADGGTIENVVYSKPGLATEKLLDECRRSGVGKKEDETRKLLREMDADGRLHAHRLTTTGNPVVWFVSTASCPHCAIE